MTDKSKTARPIRIAALLSEKKLAAQVKSLANNKGLKVVFFSEDEALLKNFDTEFYDIVILGGSFSKKKNSNVTELLFDLSSKQPATQVLFFVAEEDIHFARPALNAGTYQYAKLPVGNEELKILIESALDRRPQILLNGDESESLSNKRFGQLIGRSPGMQKVYRQIRQAASTEIPILLLGETGTGKDLAAQIIHQESERSNGPFIPVNLGALPSDLVASELFGHEKGSFTGSVEQHKGVFERGRNGTVFLDEIDVADEKVQISLLRLIEQKKFNRLGGKKAIKSNARLITASNADLETLVEQGLFRKDLFFRLDVFRITLPPLNIREGDIPLICGELIAQYNNTFNKNILDISQECLDLFEAYEWPGNVRELKNVIQRAVLVCEGDEILPEHLPPRFQSLEPVRKTMSFEIGTPLHEVEKQMVVQALKAADDNRRKAAELLGISRRAIYNKLRKHNLI